MILVYHILSTLAAPLVALVFALVSLFTRNKRRGLLDHFGRVPTTDPGDTRKTLWLHALSMGEVTAAAPVLDRVRSLRPDIRIVVSVTTDSGYDAARIQLPFADRILFHPLDCLPFTWAAVNRIRPGLFVMTDTGFWPGLLDVLFRQRIPAILFNGRISKRSYRRYQMLGSFTKEVLGKFTILCMQNPRGEEMVRSLGADPARVRVIGDPKFDALPSVSKEERERIRSRFGIAASAPVWIAGSTHEGEEEILIGVYKKLKTQFPDLAWILAPRRVERVNAVASLLHGGGIVFVKRSAIQESGAPGPANVILLDTMGELAGLYAIATVAFVGRSLVAPGGGHSLIEPVAQGVPAVHGPFIENIRHMADMLYPHGLAREVKTGEEMVTALNSLLADPAHLARLADKARSLIRENQGASARMAEILTTGSGLESWNFGVESDRSID
ncbi:MAG: 3-deoxy-D-manno-octulosonic acid transferase [Nitrospinaceae bacterium]